MLDLLKARLQQKHRTLAYPDGPLPPLPERFRGLPVLEAGACASGCGACEEVCPTEAVTVAPRLRMDLGRCLFCGLCSDACPTGAVSFSRDVRMAVRQREQLWLEEDRTLELARELEAESLRRFSRSLHLRQVSAGGCNACEAEINVLSTIVWDLGRLGIKIVASPRHADGLIITGPVTENMRQALEKTYAAVAPPKLVIAVGACAISGGPFAGHPEVHDGAGSTVPVDLYVPGCPPHPATILDGLLRLLGRLDSSRIGES